MAEAAGIYVEVWPFAADEKGIWLLTGAEGPWTASEPIRTDSSPHFEVELALHEYGHLSADEVVYLHSPSWRWRPGFGQVNTYVAVVDCAGPVIEHWPDAAPMTSRLAAAVGKPPQHGATEEPAPRELDVAWHALRHVRHELLNNAVTVRALNHWWHVHTEALAPVLAGLYQDGDGRGDVGRAA